MPRSSPISSQVSSSVFPEYDPRPVPGYGFDPYYGHGLFSLAVALIKITLSSYTCTTKAAALSNHSSYPFLIMSLSCHFVLTPLTEMLSGYKLGFQTPPAWSYSNTDRVFIFTCLHMVQLCSGILEVVSHGCSSEHGTWWWDAQVNSMAASCHQDAHEPSWSCSMLVWSRVWFLVSALLTLI